jgi:hypothetical protein
MLIPKASSNKYIKHLNAPLAQLRVQGCVMASLDVKRIADDGYTVRQDDELLSVELVEINAQMLAGGLRVRDLVRRTLDECSIRSTKLPCSSAHH